MLLLLVPLNIPIPIPIPIFILFTMYKIEFVQLNAYSLPTGTTPQCVGREAQQKSKKETDLPRINTSDESKRRLWLANLGLGGWN